MKHTIATVVIAALAATTAFADVEPIVYEGHPVMSEIKTLYRRHEAERWTNETFKAEWKAFENDSARQTAYLDDVLSYMDENGITTNDNSIIWHPEVYVFNSYVDGGYDAKFAARGQFCCNEWWLANSPLCFTNWLNDVDGGIAMATNDPVRLDIRKAIAERGRHGIPTAILFNYYAEASSEPTRVRFALFCGVGVYSIDGYERIAPGLISKVIPEIKKWLRKSGKSFLTKEDGTNPVQSEVDALQTALNAPKFAGLREWVAKLWPDYQWVEPTWKTDEEINQLKDDIYYGQKDFDIKNKILLQSHLGTDAYNAFVEEYNK